MSSIQYVENVISRLRQMRQLREDAADTYFLPDRFQIALQNCITTSRTVTFILQSNKRAFSEFDEWYLAYQSKWRNDPIMRWAVEARNTIEKKGDLKTFSQIKCNIICSYIGCPHTKWMPQALFDSPRQLLFSIPDKFLAIPHIVENGTLVIERRWIDSSLPDYEVLEALAYVYREFSILLVDLLNRIGVKAPSDVADILPKSMQPLVMDRAIYLSIKDGSEIGIRMFSKPIEGINEKVLMRHYKNTVNWKGMAEAKTFREICDVLFRNARAMMTKDSYHISLAILCKGVSVIRILFMDLPTRASKYLILREIAALAKIECADGVILISEAWEASKEDVPASGFAEDAKNRRESLSLVAASSDGKCYQYSAIVERKKIKKHKVKRILTTDFSESRFQYVLSPFQVAWGCLDSEELKKSETHLEELGINPLSNKVGTSADV